MDFTPPPAVSRRAALKLAAGGVGGAVVAPALAHKLGGTTFKPSRAVGAVAADADMPVDRIEDIIRAKGTVSNGVLNIQVERDDLRHIVKEPFGVPIKPAFEINGNLCFQSLGGGNVMFNGDLCFKPSELNAALRQALNHGIVFQAMHQHLFSLSPMVWFMHFRAKGDAEAIARGMAAVISATSTPLPQAPPKNPTTPLHPDRLADIIGSKPTVGNSGVVSFEIPRANPVVLDGVRISPYLNIYIPVDFQPLDDSGKQAVAVPDFGMVYREIPGLMTTMLSQGWQVDCLYNQETDEDPQLYFSHQLKVGDPYELAREIRKGLDQLDVRLH